MEDFLTLSNREKRGVVVLILMLALLLYFRFRPELSETELPSVDNILINSDTTEKEFTYSKEPVFVDRPVKKSPRKSDQRKNPIRKIPQKRSISDKPFMANEVTDSILKSYDINKRARSNWLKYIDAGGHIHNMEGLKKIYALTEVEIKRLESRIRFPKNSQKKVHKYPPKIEMPKIDLNLCTAEELQKLRGIGQVLSSRIIRFRESLGGFHRVEQLADVYGISDSLFQEIKIHVSLKDPKWNKILINSIDLDSLKMHPLFDWKTSKLTIAYRNQHGSFKDSLDFKKMRFLQSEDYNKILPYLDFRDYTGMALYR